MNPLLEGLNPPQIEAVTSGPGPVLVLAGAGSGKTRVITHRIAQLVLHGGVDPSRIVAVTFTNKAAGEMRSRVERLLGAAALPAWIGTFHALCLRILRRDGQRIGLPPGFVVYDSDDQLALVRRILREEATDDAPVAARPVLTRISRAKNAMVSPAEMAARAFSPEAKLAARAYELYEERLKLAFAVDFDDLLLRALHLLRTDDEAGARYAGRCEHLLVDEYQDTNRPQYALVSALSAVHGNVFVVGDEDQSIYRFRGADIRNILDFEKDHPGARVVKLEENYRSTGTILEAAGAVVARNRSRKGKTLWTKNVRGEPIELFRAPDDRAEAKWIARRIDELLAGHGHEDFAVLYRTNAQSRLIEESLRAHRLPYQVVGSVRFYERREVKDLLAYLRIACDPADDVSFRRIVNTPPRGIGDATLATLEDAARARGVPLEKAADSLLGEGLVSPRTARALAGFLDLLGRLEEQASREPAVLLLERLIADLGYADHLAKTHPGEGADRMDNVRALVSAAAEYQEETGEGGLQGFLDRSALVSDADEVGARPGITLLTVHCAKGLEFPVVFLAGLEENLFPHVRSRESEDDLEEERRLCYVAMTRARERLLLSRAEVRRVQGEPVHASPSRFLFEIPQELVREVFPTSWDRVSEAPRGGHPIGYSASGSSAARAAARRPSPEPVPAPPRPTGPPPADGFGVGTIVTHPSFGSGRVVGREGEGKALKLTIHFAGRGSKKILPAYTTLEVVSRS
jgi:DNA helicase II / ATP-dependent DNA helicase PcrA